MGGLGRCKGLGGYDAGLGIGCRKGGPCRGEGRVEPRAAGERGDCVVVIAPAPTQELAPSEEYSRVVRARPKSTVIEVFGRRPISHVLFLDGESRQRETVLGIDIDRCFEVSGSVRSFHTQVGEEISESVENLGVRHFPHREAAFNVDLGRRLNKPETRSPQVAANLLGEDLGVGSERGRECRILRGSVMDQIKEARKLLPALLIAEQEVVDQGPRLGIELSFAILLVVQGRFAIDGHKLIQRNWNRAPQRRQVMHERQTDVDRVVHHLEASVELGETLGKPRRKVAEVVLRDIVHVLVKHDFRGISGVGVDRDVVCMLTSHEVPADSCGLSLVKDLIRVERPVVLEDVDEGGDRRLQLVVGELGEHRAQLFEIDCHAPSRALAGVRIEAKVVSPHLDPPLARLWQNHLTGKGEGGEGREGARDRHGYQFSGAHQVTRII